MFGLMRSRACSMTASERHHRRLHYCGTCKTMGRLYGQKTRLLLNYDTVFMAELLTALSGEDELVNQWSNAYQSYNCFSLPDESGEMPLALQYAAAATVVLAEFKVADHIADTGKLRWRFVNRAMSSPFNDAARQMAEWQFPFDELRRLLQSQHRIEAEALSSSAQASPDEMLRSLSEPTAAATAMVMLYGARMVGKQEAEEIMHRVGHSFGAIAYLLDALEDYERDFRNGQFNALRAAFDVSESRLSKQHRAQGEEIIRAFAEKTEEAIAELPIPKTRAEMFASRLRQNLSTRLGAKLPVIHHSCAPKIKMSLRERWRAAKTTAKALTIKRTASHRSKLAAHLQSPFVFASALPVAFMLPQHARSANSYRECMGMAMNLMLIGSAFATAGHASAEMEPGMGEGGAAGGEATEGRRGRKKPVLEDSGSHWWCCHCDGCDCCCHFHDCSCCDGCDCCSCDC